MCFSTMLNAQLQPEEHNTQLCSDGHTFEHTWLHPWTLLLSIVQVESCDFLLTVVYVAFYYNPLATKEMNEGSIIA